MIDDQHAEPIGPRRMAEELSTRIPQLQAAIAAADTDPSEKRRLRNLLKINRDLLRFCKTRAGY